MNFLKVLNETNIYFSTIDIQNKTPLDTWEVIQIINNKEIFDTILEGYTEKNINNLDAYSLYLICLKISFSHEVIDNLKNKEDKEFLTKLITNSNEIARNIKNAEIVAYINNNYKDIFLSESSALELKKSTIGLIKKFQGGINIEVFEYLANEHNYLIIDNYTDFEKILNNKSYLFDFLFKEATFDEIDSLRFSSVLNMWNYIKKTDNSVLKNKVDNLTNNLYESIVAKKEQIDINNVFFFENKIKCFYQFLVNTKNVKTNDFRRILNDVKKMSSNSVVQNGQVFKYEIPIKEIIEHLDKIEGWEIKQLFLTHDLTEENSNISFISRLSRDSTVKSSLIDFFQTNISVDDYYTLSQQQYLSLVSNIGRSTLIGLCLDKTHREEYLTQLKSVFQYLSKTKIYENENLNEFGEILISYCHTIFSNINVKSSEKMLCYGGAMYTCAFTEKLIRALYLFLINDKFYVQPEKATLSKLLSEENKEIVEIFEIKHIKNLRFFISQTGDNHVGENYRNSIAHLYDISPDSFNVTFYGQLLWLFTDVLNTIFAYCWKNNF